MGKSVFPLNGGKGEICSPLWLLQVCCGEICVSLPINHHTTLSFVPPRGQRKKGGNPFSLNLFSIDYIDEFG